MKSSLKTLAAAVTLAIVASSAAQAEAAGATTGYAERTYAEFAATSGEAVSFEVATLDQGPLTQLAGRPYASFLEASTYVLRADQGRARFESAGRTSAVARKADSADKGSAIEEFADSDLANEAGTFRHLAVIVKVADETRTHDALELCWAARGECVIVDASVEFGDTLVSDGAHSKAATTTPGLTDKRNALLAAHIAKRRTKCGANSLVMSTAAGNAAVYHAKDMATENYFSHNSQSPFEVWHERIDRFVSGQVGGENIAYGFSTVNGVMDGWMNSTGHKRNIMDCAFKKVGFGYAENTGSNGKRYWVADFLYN